MDSVFKYFNGFFTGLTGLLVNLLALGVVIEILFGQSAFGMTVIDNVMGVVQGLGSQGFVGVVALLILWSFFSKK